VLQDESLLGRKYTTALSIDWSNRRIQIYNVWIDIAQGGNWPKISSPGRTQGTLAFNTTRSSLL